MTDAKTMRIDWDETKIGQLEGRLFVEANGSVLSAHTLRVQRGTLRWHVWCDGKAVGSFKTKAEAMDAAIAAATAKPKQD